MRRLLLACMLLAMVLGAGGCATAGREITSADIEKIEIGKTTYPETVAIFGPPWKVLAGKDITICVWRYRNSGFLGAGEKVQGFGIAFDKDGKALHYSLNDPSRPDGGISIGGTNTQEKQQP